MCLFLLREYILRSEYILGSGLSWIHSTKLTEVHIHTLLKSWGNAGVKDSPGYLLHIRSKS